MGGAYFFAPLLYLHSSTEIAALQERILSERAVALLDKLLEGWQAGDIQ